MSERNRSMLTVGSPSGYSAEGPRSDDPESHRDQESADQLFSALAHASRRQILRLLKKRGAMSAGTIAAQFDCAWPTTTRHLRTLENAQLVSVKRLGRHRMYRLNPARISSATALIEQCSSVEDAVEADDAP